MGEMDKEQFKYLDTKDSRIAYLGSMSANKALLFIGRSNTQKNSAPLLALLDRLILDHYVLFWPESRKQSISSFLILKSERIVRSLDRIFGSNECLVKKYSRKIIKALILTFYPSKWDYLFMQNQSTPISSQIKFYRRLIRSLGKDKSISILSHSAGGLIASHLTDEPQLEKIICFGYPFKHPDKGEEIERTANLKVVQKPFLIIQGTKDEYGGNEVVNRYELSPYIEFEFVEAGHDYENLLVTDWSSVIQRIEDFLDLRV